MLSFFNNLFNVSEPLTDNFYYLSLLKNDNNVYGYSIHGFWPNYGKGGYPSFCKKVEFDINKLNPIMKDLIDFWDLPEDHDKKEVSFWKHEWQKHGSCMFCDNMSELEYFQKALKLYLMVMNEKMDIEQYKKGKNYMIPFNLNFELIRV